MKTIILVRHAKSSWKYPELTDEERPLNKRGKRDAPNMAQLLLELKVKPDVLLSSPAIRAKRTAKIVADYLNCSDKVKYKAWLYSFSTENILTKVNSFKSEWDTVMMFGHNPAFTSLVNYWGDDFLENLPTCGAYALSFETENWSQVRQSKGKTLFYEFPKKHFY